MCPGYNWIITCHAKKQEDTKLNEKRQSKDANTEMTEVLELHSKSFKAAMTKVLQWAIMNILETNEDKKVSEKK